MARTASCHIGSLSTAGGPGSVDDGPGTDGVTDIVGTVSEGGSAGGQHLNEGVAVLDLIRVLLGVCVDASHTVALGGALETRLSSVDVVVHAVEKAGSDLGRDTLEEDLHVVELVDAASAHWVVTKGAHGPAHGAGLLQQLGAKASLTLGNGVLVRGARSVFHDEALLIGGGNGVSVLMRFLEVFKSGNGARGAGGLELIFLHDGVLSNLLAISLSGGGAGPEERSHEDHPRLDCAVLPDDLGVDVGNEEDGGEQAKTGTGADSDGGDVPRRLLVETKLRRALVDNGQSADGASNEEPKRCRVNGPGHRVLAGVHDDLDETKDECAKASGGGRGNDEAGEDGTKTLALVPSPLDLGGTSGSDTDTGDGGDERVGGGDVS